VHRKEHRVQLRDTDQNTINSITKPNGVREREREREREQVRGRKTPNKIDRLCAIKTAQVKCKTKSQAVTDKNPAQEMGGLV
jgi:hypothetical protein